MTTPPAGPQEPRTEAGRRLAEDFIEVMRAINGLPTTVPIPASTEADIVSAINRKVAAIEEEAAAHGGAPAALREALRKATNGGNWRVRHGQPADSFQPDGYRYVQFGPSEKTAAGLGTDQLAPADAELIVAAVNFARLALSENTVDSRRAGMADRQGCAGVVRGASRR